MAARKAKRARGGRRPGAGRKPVLEDPVSVTFDAEGSQVDALREIAQEEGISVAEALRRMLRVHLRRRKRG